MKSILILPGLAWLIATAPVGAQSNAAASACDLARDPARCEAREDALKSCADLRGVDKRLCLDAHVLPVDCGLAQDPARCERIQQAKANCSEKIGADYRRCLREQSASGNRAKKKTKKIKPHPAAKKKTVRAT